VTLIMWEMQEGKRNCEVKVKGNSVVIRKEISRADSEFGQEVMNY
jgi:hypothetical protein